MNPAARKAGGIGNENTVNGNTFFAVKPKRGDEVNLTMVQNHPDSIIASKAHNGSIESKVICTIM